MSRRAVLAGAVFFCSFFLFGFFYFYHWPRIRKWITVEIERQSRIHLPLRIWPEDVELTAFPPGLSLKQVRVLPANDLKETLEPFLVKKLDLTLSLLGLLTADLRIGTVKFHEASIVMKTNAVPDFLQPLQLRKANSKPLDLPELNFSLLQKLPFDEVQMEHMDFKLVTPDPEAHILFKNARGNFENRDRAAAILAELPNLIVKIKSEPEVALGLSLNGVFEEKLFHFNQIRIDQGENFLSLAGTFRGRLQQLSLERTDLNLRMHAELQSFLLQVQKFVDVSHFHGSRGTLDFELVAQQTEKKKSQVKFKGKTNNLHLSKFEVGDLQFSGEYESSKLSIDRVEVKNSAGLARLKGGHLILDKAWAFRSRLQAQDLELRQLLVALGVGETPLHLDMNGDLPCHGTLKPFFLKCEGQLTASRFLVHGGPPEKRAIVAFNQGNISGSVEVDASQVVYSADLRIGSAVGKSSGKINYATGFDINYEGDIKSIDELENLANLKVEGAFQVKGRTYGTSKFGRIEMNAQGQRAWLENYFLDQARFDVHYKEGVLGFRNIKGSLETSQYEGNVSIHLREKRIFVNGRSSALFAHDIPEVFSRRFKPNFTLSGTGTSTVKIWGPLQFSKLSYEMNTSLFKGSFNNETFDRFDFQVEAQDGFLSTKRVQITKGSGVSNLSGKVSPEGKADLYVSGQGLRLEQSELLDRLGLRVLGRLDFNMTYEGQILKPDITARGRLSGLKLGDSPTDSVDFKIKANERRIQSDGSIFGTRLTYRAHIPLVPNEPFKVDLETKEWDIMTLFSLFTPTNSQHLHRSALDHKISLFSPTGKSRDLSGKMDVTRFEFSRASQSLVLPRPARANLKNGLIQIQGFEIRGDENILSLRSESSSIDNLNLTLSGKLNLSFVSFLVPFLEDLRGAASFGLNMKGSLSAPRLSGSTYIQKGFAKLKGLPHAFSNVTSDILFNNNKVVVNSTKGEFAGGTLSADGKVEIKGLHSVPMDFRFSLDGISLHVPEDVRTRGRADLRLSGSWFPYLLSGTYDISYGDIEKNLSMSKQRDGRVKPSAFLPKFLLEENFEPIEFDLAAQIRRPLSVKLIDANLRADATINGQMRILGPLSKPLLSGRLSTGRDSRVFLRSHQFDIRSGYLEYAKSEPENPQLNVEALARVQATNTGESYELNLAVRGAAKDPRITLSSEPSLSEQDLKSLLALGITSGTDTPLATPKEDSQLGNTIGTTVFKELLLNNQLAERFGVDVDLSSTMDDTESQISVPKVTIRKQWNKKFGASASRSFGKTPKNDVKLEYRMNRNWSVTGNWNRKDLEGTSDITTQKDTSTDIFGIDLEYKVEFK